MKNMVILVACLFAIACSQVSESIVTSEQSATWFDPGKEECIEFTDRGLTVRSCIVRYADGTWVYGNIQDDHASASLSREE